MLQIRLDNCQGGMQVKEVALKGTCYLSLSSGYAFSNPIPGGMAGKYLAVLHDYLTTSF
jgi:hypothetical protein